MSNKAPCVIADSSFYICFLDDITCPALLNLILEGPFQFLITRIVHDEIKASENYLQIQTGRLKKLEEHFDISEILRPFFGRGEASKGEHEVVAFSLILYENDPDLIIILDDAQPRKILERHNPRLANNTYGTVGFVVSCHCDYAILQKRDTLEAIRAVEESKFRVSGDIIRQAESQVRGC